MKTLLLLSCVAYMTACGSSSGVPPADFTAPPLQSSTSQTPQTPGDSVPPVNAQQPPSNSQQPSLGGGTMPTAITCDQLASAVRGAGCRVSDSLMTQCIAGTLLSAPCGAQWQGLLGCILHFAVCNNNGQLNLGNSCNDQNDALGACLDNAIITPVNCAPASNCNGCATDCTRCMCEAITTPTQNCTQRCLTTN